ncbi:MAG: matrixin family metalloprotease, partial [Burkholderiales bacterium]|nr:matrixin family metalloprotease [Burkholderiales bacterium]
LASGANLTCTGSGESIAASAAYDNITLGNNSSANITGNSDSVNFGTGDTATVTGNSNNFALAAGDNLTCTGTGEIVAGNSAVINLGANTSATFTGSNDAVNLSANANSNVSIYGSGQVVNGDAGNNIVNLGGAGTSATVYGGGYVGLNGANETLTLGSAGSTVGTVSNATVETIVDNGGNAQINLGSGFTGGISGKNDVVNMNANANSIVSIYGSGQIVNGDTGSNSVYMGGIGTSATVYGGGYVGLSSANETLTLGSAGSTVGIIAAGETIYGSNDNVYLTSNSGATIIGGSNKIGLLGNGDSVTASGALITALSNNLTTTLNGTGNFIATNLYGGDVFNGVGNNTTLDAGSNDTLNLASSGETVNILSHGTGNTVDGTLGGDVINLATSASATIKGIGNIVDLYGNYANATCSGDTVNMGNGITSANLNGSNNNVFLGAAGENLNISGTGETIHASGDVVTLGASSARIIGNGNTINATGGDTIFTAASNQNINVTGSGSLIVGTGDYITLYGNGTTVTVNGGAGKQTDVFAAAGTNDTVIYNFAATGNSVVEHMGIANPYAQYFSGANGTGRTTGWGNIGGIWNPLNPYWNYSPKWNTGYIPNGYAPPPTSVIPFTNIPVIPLPGPSLPHIIPPYNPIPIIIDVTVIGYGFAGKQSTIDASLGQNIGSIAQYDLSQGDPAAANAADMAQRQAYEVSIATPTKAGAASVVLEAAKWDQQVITWSLANSPGTSDAPFSHYMDSSYESSVQSAFAAWAAADPGVKFKEVAASSQSDIRIGFGKFDTTNTGIVGLTSYKQRNGQLLPDAIVRVEDPTQVSLIAGANGQQIYAGTDATITQVLIHEIGHALGLGVNADPNSIMNYALTSNNRSLDGTDLAGINLLYGPTPASTSPVYPFAGTDPMTSQSSVSASLNSLIAAMGAFAPPSSSQTSLAAANGPSFGVPLLAAAH